MRDNRRADQLLTFVLVGTAWASCRAAGETLGSLVRNDRVAP